MTCHSYSIRAEVTSAVKLTALSFNVSMVRRLQEATRSVDCVPDSARCSRFAKTVSLCLAVVFSKQCVPLCLANSVWLCV